MQVALQPTMTQVLFTGLPHLARLSGVARVLVPALTAKATNYASWNSEDRSLPADVLPLLFEQAEHFPLEGRGLHCLGTELLVDLGDFLFGSLQDPRLLNSDSDSKGRILTIPKASPRDQGAFCFHEN